MSEDLLDDLLGLEDGFYQEGYVLGHADGVHAGLVEGKLFGIEKGSEKAHELGMLSGRAQVWARRVPESISGSVSEINKHHGRSLADQPGLASVSELPPISKNLRLKKHIESLKTTTDSSTLSTSNSDDSVADFDERLQRAIAKAKVIANIVSEPVYVDEMPARGDAGKTNPQGHVSIEDASNLSARH